MGTTPRRGRPTDPSVGALGRREGRPLMRKGVAKREALWGPPLDAVPTVLLVATHLSSPSLGVVPEATSSALRPAQPQSRGH